MEPWVYNVSGQDKDGVWDGELKEDVSFCGDFPYPQHSSLGEADVIFKSICFTLTEIFLLDCLHSLHFDCCLGWWKCADLVILVLSAPACPPSLPLISSSSLSILTEHRSHSLRFPWPAGCRRNGVLPHQWIRTDCQFAEINKQRCLRAFVPPLWRIWHSYYWPSWLTL